MGALPKSVIRHVLSVFVLFSSAGTAQDTSYVRSHYRKQEVMVPMRDGVRLFTSIYEPRDSTLTYPVLFTRTPYGVGPYGDAYPGSLGPSFDCTREGFVVVYQDVRGRMMSEGDFVDVRPVNPHKGPLQETDESTDTYDTIDWIIHHLHHINGTVGMWGVSYPGFYASMGLIDAHPALKAVSPQAPIADWFIGDDFHHNGVLMLMDSFSFFSGFGRKRVGPTTQPAPGYQFATDDAYDFYLHLGKREDVAAKYFRNEVPFWNDIVGNEVYNSFWQARNIVPHLQNITPAVLVVGGWFDAEDFYGSISTFEAVEHHRHGARNMLVVGPWSHGEWAWGKGTSLGALKFPLAASETFKKDIELPFFRHYLKGDGTDTQPNVLGYCTGSNEWRSFDRWPPSGVRDSSFYIAAHGGLGGYPSEDAACDTYESDPAKPVPYTAGIGIDRTAEYMIEDQRFAARRPDVLVYQTRPLDGAITIAGPVTADLFLATTGSDADVVVKLIDVFPDTATSGPANGCGARLGGYQMLLRGDVMRAKFRKSFTQPEPMAPDSVTEIRFALRDVLHTFLPGHRIMVQVQSSWFPLFDLNPQKFMNVYEAGAADYRKEKETFFRSRRFPSHIAMRVLR